MLEVSEVKQMELSNYIDIKQEIRNRLHQVVVSFVEVGFYLKKVNVEGMYKTDNYKDIWEFAKAEYNLDRTAASRFMSINDRYSVDGNSIELQEQYRGLSRSTLVEMLTLPVEDYELITPETKIADIRELKKEEQKQAEDQLEGQESIMSLMPDAVPDTEKPTNNISVGDLIRELFRPKEMKELLNRLVMSDPSSKAYEYLIEELNPSCNRVTKKIPYFLFFYKFADGLKLKNVVSGEIKDMTYKDFYFEVRNTFGTECVESPSDVWSAAYGKEVIEQAEKVIEEKTEVKNAESLDFTQCEADSKEPQKVPETTEIRSEKSEKESNQPKEEQKTPENEPDKNAEKLDFTPLEPDSRVEEKTEIVEGEVGDESVCDIAQNTISVPVLPGDNIFGIYISDSDEDMNPIYAPYETTVYMYEYRHKKTIDMRYFDNKNDSKTCTLPVDGEYSMILNDNGLFLSKEYAEKRCAELNGEA